MVNVEPYPERLVEISITRYPEPGELALHRHNGQCLGMLFPEAYLAPISTRSCRPKRLPGHFWLAT